MTIESAYVGRFAPSPTGPLHFGSLVTALGSFLDARARGGKWLVRIEDIDPPREVSGATTSILRSLEAHGLHWDGPLVRQSRRTDAYLAALATLRAAGLTYPCACTRKEIADSQQHFERAASNGAPVYPGTCRSGMAPGRQPRAERVRADATTISFDDRVQGRISQRLDRDVGDFVLRRADGLIAYQLAVVVDDAAQGVSTVVRGADLLDSTPRQIFLQQLLGLPTPRYVHLPVVVNAAGEKLSKQTRAPALDDAHAVSNLLRALRFLGQAPHRTLGTVDEVLAWAQATWNLGSVPAVPSSLDPETRDQR